MLMAMVYFHWHLESGKGIVGKTILAESGHDRETGVKIEIFQS